MKIYAKLTDLQKGKTESLSSNDCITAEFASEAKIYKVHFDGRGILVEYNGNELLDHESELNINQQKGDNCTRCGKYMTSVEMYDGTDGKPYCAECWGRA